MATQLAADVVLTYNGITFPVYTETTGISGTPVYDASGRTVIYVVYNLTVRSIISVSGIVDADVGDEMDELRQALTKPGGELVYQNNGFGQFEINTLKADVKWGPKPKMLSWKPKGTTQSVEITWQVEVAITECEQGGTGIPLGSQRPPMEYCWKVNFAVDASGYTTKTVSGHVAIAQTRRGVTDRTLSDHADRLRESIAPPCPVRFRPTSRNFSLSDDKCRLDFSFSFEQMPPNVPPPGVIRVSATHSAETPNLAMAIWTGTISATYEVAFNVPRKETMLLFLELVQDRLDQFRKARQVVQAGDWAGGLLAAANLRGFIIPARLSISENIYDRESATFSLSYRTTLDKGSLPRAVELLGFFRPVPNGDWNRWYQSMREQRSPLHPRGTAGLGFDASEDRLIDLCLNLDQGVPLAAPSEFSIELGPPNAPGNDLSAEDVFRKINGFGEQLQPEQSWLDIKQALRVETTDNVQEQRLLPTAPVQDVRPQQFRPEDILGGIRLGPVDAPASVIQRRGKPTVAVILEGQGIRAGYAISPPTLNSIGGVEAIPANREGQEFFVSQVATESLYPICVARWRLRWLLPEMPKVPLGPPVNPMYGEVVVGEGRLKQ